MELAMKQNASNSKVLHLSILFLIICIGICHANEKASLIIYAGEKSQHPIPRNITGKFCEHLYFNITNGMDAQILRNPTFSDYPFRTSQMSPDGIATFHYDRKQIENNIRILSLNNVGADVIRVDFDRTTGAQSYQLQPGDGLSIKVSYSDALKVRVSTAAGDSSSMNVQQEGD